MRKGYGMAHAPALVSGPPKKMSPGNAPGLGGRADVKGGDAALVVSLRPGVDSARLVLLHHLSMQVDIETFDFGSLTDPQANDEVDDLEDDVGHDRAVDEGASHIVELDQHLMRVAVGQPTFAQRVDGVGSECTRQHGTKRATHGMHAERIQRIVITEELLNVHRREVADDSG